MDEKTKRLETEARAALYTAKELTKSLEKGIERGIRESDVIGLGVSTRELSQSVLVLEQILHQ